MNLLLSVIIPTLDRQHILAKTLDSIVRATEALSAEIIVVNDSKTENVTVAYPQITVLNNPRQGAASATSGASCARW
jgi:glycosyltransferase involved in cell wall biosynthesis